MVWDVICVSSEVRNVVRTTWYAGVQTRVLAVVSLYSCIEQLWLWQLQIHPEQKRAN